MKPDAMTAAEQIIAEAEADRIGRVLTSFRKRLRKGGFDEDYIHEHCTAMLEAILSPGCECYEDGEWGE